MPIFDAHTIAVIFGVAFAGGLLGLDRTAAGQFMVSQPIVAGPFIGWLLGDAAAGLVIGAVLELIWVLDMPVGTFVPADSTIGAISATAIAALCGRGSASLDLIGFSILLTTGMVPITMMVDVAVRKNNSRLIDAALSAPGDAVGKNLSRAHLAGLAVFFLKSFALYLVFVPVGLVAVSLFAALPEKAHTALALFVKLLPLLGIALVARKLSVRNLDRFFLAGFAVAALLAVVLHMRAPVIILLVITAGFLGARYSERSV
jgi:PTS system mannose-specific IIC component